MSSPLIVRTAIAAVLAAAIGCGGAALAKAASLDDLIAGQLIGSDAPPLLGPITSAGRKGWECKPERAAAARLSHEAELPPDPTSP
jgi:hypothetical protein